MATLNTNIRDYVSAIERGMQPNVKAFFTEPNNRTALDSWMAQYTCAQEMKKAFLRKFRTLQQKHQMRGKKTIGGVDLVNWSLEHQNARTTEAYLLNGSAIMEVTAGRVRREIINRMEYVSDQRSASSTPVASDTAAPTNTASTNAALTNAASTNAAPTNAAPTNAAPTNAAPTVGDEDYDDNMDEDEDEVSIATRRSSLTPHTVPDKLSVGDLPVERLIAQSGFDITTAWHQYKELSLDKANRHNLYVASELQKLMSLSHIMLLSSDGYDKDMINIFGADVLEDFYLELRNKYLSKAIKFDPDMFNEVKDIVELLKDGDKTMTRTKAHMSLASMLENAGSLNARILHIIFNCISKLSKTEKSYVIAETELITNYLDPILSPMFHDPDSNRLFRWLNQKSNMCETETNTRPDGGMSVVEQLQDVYALGFVEVKAICSAKKYVMTHTDTLRLSMFCKAALDNNIKCAMAVQAVGTHVTFFLCTIEAEALYPFLKIGRLDVPTSFESLPTLLSQLDTCARIMNTYDTFCTKRSDKDPVCPRTRLSLTQSQLSDVLHELNRNATPSLILTPTI